MEATPNPQPKRRRARKSNGKFQGDDPNTVTNEAWESISLDQAVGETEVKYEVKKKVESTSKPSAGKYSRKGKVKPTFGNVTTTFN